MLLLKLNDIDPRKGFRKSKNAIVGRKKVPAATPSAAKSLKIQDFL